MDDFDVHQMTDAEKSEELTAAVTTTLLQRGVLNEIKAKVRAEVLLALEHQKSEQNESENSMLKEMAADPDALRTLKLIHQFLSCYGLISTQTVLEAECPLVVAEASSARDNEFQATPALVRIVAAAGGGHQTISTREGSASQPEFQGSTNTRIAGGSERGSEKESQTVEGFPIEVYRARQLALKKLRSKISQQMPTGQENDFLNISGISQ